MINRCYGMNPPCLIGFVFGEISADINGDVKGVSPGYNSGAKSRARLFLSRLNLGRSS